MKKFCEALMAKEIEVQVQAFLKGFRSIISTSFTSHLSSSEFELIITGVQTIDVEEMQRTCSYQDLSATSDLSKWFWEILKDFTQAELSSFIYFLSGILVLFWVKIIGATKLPYEGTRQKPIRLRKSNYSEQSLPLAHTW